MPHTIKEGSLLKVGEVEPGEACSRGVLLEPYRGQSGVQIALCGSGLVAVDEVAILGSYGVTPFLMMIADATKKVGVRQATDEVGGFLLPISGLTYRVTQSQAPEYNPNDLVFAVCEEFERQEGDDEYVFGRIASLTRQVRGIGRWEVSLDNGARATLSVDTFANLHTLR